MYSEKPCKIQGVWSSIFGSINELHDSNIIPISTMNYKVGMGDKAKFWIDPWLGNQTLKDCYNRLFRLEANAMYKVCDRWQHGTWHWDWVRFWRSGAIRDQFQDLISNLSLFNVIFKTDSWQWDLIAIGDFSVRITRKYIGNLIMPN